MRRMVSKLASAAIICVLVSGEVFGEQVGEQNTAPILEFLTAELKGNFETIRTLQGEADIVEQTVVENPNLAVSQVGSSEETLLPGWFKISQPVEVSFVIDLQDDRLYSKYRHSAPRSLSQIGGPDRYESFASGSTFHQESILTGTDYISLFKQLALQNSLACLHCRRNDAAIAL